MIYLYIHQKTLIVKLCGNIRAYTYTHTQSHTHTLTLTLTRARTRSRAHTHTHWQSHTHTHTRTHILAHAHTHTHTPVHIYTHIYTHKHAHTLTVKQSCTHVDTLCCWYIHTCTSMESTLTLTFMHTKLHTLANCMTDVIKPNYVALQLYDWRNQTNTLCSTWRFINSCMYAHAHSQNTIKLLYYVLCTLILC